MSDTLSLLKRAHQGDKKARDALTEENMGLVWSVVQRFSGRKAEKEDLFQVGVIGLIKAIDKFDLQYGVCFSTYAVPMIMGEIRRYLRDDGMIRVSRSLKESAVQLYRAREKLERISGREPTFNELAGELAMEPEEVAMVLEASADVESLERTTGSREDREQTLMDRLEDQSDLQKKVTDHLLVQQLLEGVSAQEKYLLYMRYGREMTQSGIAAELGLSQVQVSRMEKKILQKIRKRQKLPEQE